MRQGLWWAGVLAISALVSGCGEQAVASLEFVSVSPEQPKIGDIATLSVRALDSRGLPMAGVAVNFELASDSPDVVLSPDVAVTNKGDGIAQTQVSAKTGRVFAVRVIARAGDKQVTSVPFSFAGTVASGRQFTFQCGSIAGDRSTGGIHAIGAYDRSRYLIAGVQLDCIAHVADRNGDAINGTRVSFLTEAGAIAPTGTSEPEGAISNGVVVGNTPVVFKSALPLPLNVAPETFSWDPPDDLTHTGEYLVPSWMEPYRWSEDPVANFGLPPTLQEPNRIDPLRPFDPENPLETTMNPRDNLVAMIAVTAGEEGFSDNNNNGTYDEGEPFDDLTEPFVDSNDNGTWDANELFIDTDNSGAWDGKNDRHDANTLIWVQERILWTGVPAPEDFEGVFPARNPRPAVRTISPANPDSIAVPHLGTSPLVSFLLSDPWFNAPAQNGNSDGCEIGVSSLLSTVPDQPGFKGVTFTYAAPLVVAFYLKDAHPDSAPSFPPPGNSWTLSIGCRFTASPRSNYVTIIPGPSFSGTVL